jgi:hypothetical protein
MKFLFDIGYRAYVIDADQAQVIWDVLRDAEVYEEKRNYGSGGAGRTERVTTYHVYDQEELCEPVQMKMLTDRQYNMAKLAGKPEE